MHNDELNHWIDLACFLSTARWIYKRLFFVCHFIKYDQYRSIKIKEVQFRLIKSQFRYVHPFVGRSFHPSIHWSVHHTFVNFPNFRVIKIC